MIRQYWQLMRILSDRHVTTVPRRVLAQLAREGKRRLPSGVEKSLSHRLPGVKGFSFMRRWLDGEQITRHDRRWVINSFLPPFPGQAFDRMFDNMLSVRRLSPVSAFLAVTGECSYHCWHCSYNRRSLEDLPTSEWIKLINSVHNVGASIIGFTGGEPCARTDLPELVYEASSGGAVPIVFSSGAHLNDRMLRRLKQAGLWALCLSVDHPVAAEHDRLRGAPGAHENACQVLKASRKMGFYTMMGTVATRPLVEGGLLPEIHALARHCGAHELRIMEPMPCGLLAEGREDYLFRPEHVAELRRFHVDCNRKGLRPKVCAFNQIESPELFGCGAGTQHLFIDADGNVCPCDFVAMSFGNARHEPLPAIWDRMTAAMGNPRRNCFVQSHHDLIAQHASGHFPLAPDESLCVCAKAGQGPLPDYFKLLAAEKDPP